MSRILNLEYWINIRDIPNSTTAYLLYVTTAIKNPIKNVKSFPSHKAHRAVLISISLALSQTPFYTATSQIRGSCIALCTCLRPSFRWYSLRLPTEGWPGELTWVPGYIPRWFTHLQNAGTHPSTNWAQRWLTSLIRLTMLPTKPNKKPQKIKIACQSSVSAKNEMLETKLKIVLKCKQTLEKANKSLCSFCRASVSLCSPFLSPNRRSTDSIASIHY